MNCDRDRTHAQGPPVEVLDIQLASAGPVAALDARELPHGGAALGDHARCRRPDEGRRRGLGVGGLHVAAAGASLRPGAIVARRLRRGRHPRIGPDGQAICRGRLLSSRGERRRLLARPRHAPGIERARRRGVPSHGREATSYAATFSLPEYRSSPPRRCVRIASSIRSSAARVAFARVSASRARCSAAVNLAAATALRDSEFLRAA
jgi:hypothetical protein